MQLLWAPGRNFQINMYIKLNDGVVDFSEASLWFMNCRKRRFINDVNGSNFYLEVTTAETLKGIEGKHAQKTTRWDRLGMEYAVSGGEWWDFQTESFC